MNMIKYNEFKILNHTESDLTEYERLIYKCIINMTKPNALHYTSSMILDATKIIAECKFIKVYSHKDR